MNTATTISKHAITAAARAADFLCSRAGRGLQADGTRGGRMRQPRRTRGIAWSLLASGLFCSLAGAEPAQNAPAERPEARAAFDAATAGLPLAFEPDLTAGPAGFLAEGAGYRLRLNGGQAVLTLTAAGHETSLHMAFPGADPRTAPAGLDEMPMKRNYLLGDESQWRRGVANYAKVAYRNLYRGVDLVYYGHHGQLEYDFVVAPGADATAIRMAFPGAESLRVDEGSGDLLISTAEHVQIRHQRPQIYQESASGKISVEGHYRLIDRNTVAISVAGYDPAKTLIIDPTVSFDVFAHGNDITEATGISVDSAGNSYVTGYTGDGALFPFGAGSSVAIPAKKNCVVPVFSVCGTAFLIKLSSTGAIVYTTLFGGKNSDYPSAIATDSTRAYVVGQTYSSKFFNADGSSVKGGVLQVNGQGYANSNGDTNAFLVVFDLETGQPQRHVLWGGNDFSWATAVAVDTVENAYVAGETCASDFPTSALLGGKPYQKHLHGQCAAFVTKIDANDSIKGGYSTYLSGSGTDGAAAIVVDGDGSAWVTGTTESTDFPSTEKFHAGFSNAFVTHLSADGSQILSSTIIGAQGNSVAHATALVTDGSGGTYVAGVVDYFDSPSDNLYTTPGVVQPTLPCTNFALCASGFLAHVDATGGVPASTYLGGAVNYGSSMHGTEVSIDVACIGRNRSGEIYVGGSTSTSIGFPGAPAVNPQWSAGFVTHLSASLGTVLSTTFSASSVSDIDVIEPLVRSALNPTTTIYATGAGSQATDYTAGDSAIFATKLVDATVIVNR